MLLDTFHIQRLKLAFVFILAGTINNQPELNKAIQGVSTINTLQSSGNNIKTIKH